MSSGTFDYEYYLNSNHDLKKHVELLTPIARNIWLYNHFLNHGQKEGRKHRFNNKTLPALNFDNTKINRGTEINGIEMAKFKSVLSHLPDPVTKDNIVNHSSHKLHFNKEKEMVVINDMIKKFRKKYL